MISPVNSDRAQSNKPRPVTKPAPSQSNLHLMDHAFPVDEMAGALHQCHHFATTISIKSMIVREVERGEKRVC